MLFKSITTVTCMTVYYLDLIPIFPLKLSDFKLCQLGSLCHIQQSAPETQVFVNRQTVDFMVRFKHYHITNLTAPETQVSGAPASINTFKILGFVVWISGSLQLMPQKSK